MLLTLSVCDKQKITNRQKTLKLYKCEDIIFLEITTVKLIQQSLECYCS